MFWRWSLSINAASVNTNYLDYDLMSCSERHVARSSLNNNITPKWYFVPKNVGRLSQLSSGHFGRVTIRLPTMPISTTINIPRIILERLSIGSHMVRLTNFNLGGQVYASVYPLFPYQIGRTVGFTSLKSNFAFLGLLFLLL